LVGFGNPSWTPINCEVCVLSPSFTMSHRFCPSERCTTTHHPGLHAGWTTTLRHGSNWYCLPHSCVTAVSTLYNELHKTKFLLLPVSGRKAPSGKCDNTKSRAALGKRSIFPVRIWPPDRRRKLPVHPCEACQTFYSPHDRNAPMLAKQGCSGIIWTSGTDLRHPAELPRAICPCFPAVQLL